MDRPIDVGDLVGAGFGALFVVLNAGLLGAVGHVVAAVVAVACAATVVLAYVRRRRVTGDVGMFPMTRSYQLIVALEVVALFGGTAVLGRLAPQLSVPWVVLVVGVHFLALARWWLVGARPFLVLGAVLTVIAVVGGVVGVLGGPASAPLAAFVAGVGAGVVMLGGTTPRAVRSLRD
ncbi:hypothetical protein EV188_101631 [Actinomycetospora succinea]|uniref:Uncharacterized protein n=1 Tax=Actinomycetospora succinea TaxID=663603 RepID=A0A4R6VPX2_9PSEU|nr:hypothetical protein [Actinomycetospora succinea]TDQ65381.1 hypothetical protein EV188_101631 [Actinomycetospora succinea]